MVTLGGSDMQGGFSTLKEQQRIMTIDNLIIQ
jgi:hypothetical protein